ncbi:MAG: glutathione S-transferase family protein [Pseudomonadota bacterium]
MTFGGSNLAYSLYYADGTAAMGARVLLEEVGADYELIETSVEAKGPRSPELLALNPNGWIPVLIHEWRAMYECGAITVYLCDLHPEFGLAPAANENDRGAFLQWLFYFSSSVQNAFQMTYYPFRFVDESDVEANVSARSLGRLREVWQVVDDAIGDNKWMLGDRFSAVDIYMFMLTTWFSADRGHPTVSEFPNVERVASQVSKRPSIQKVYGISN